MCAPTLIPRSALDGGIGTVRCYGDQPRNSYHGDAGERESERGSDAAAVVKEMEGLSAEERRDCEQIVFKVRQTRGTQDGYWTAIKQQ